MIQDGTIEAVKLHPSSHAGAVRVLRSSLDRLALTHKKGVTQPPHT
jgi:hypothetical protein